MTATATRTRKPVAKPARRVAISKPVNGAYVLSLTIGTGEKARRFGYYVQPVKADFGLAFHFEKFGIDQVEGEDNEYDVNLDLQYGRHSCTCKGNTYCGRCKHVEALVSLIQSGKIAVPLAKPQAKEPWCRHCNDNPEVWCEHCTL